MSASARPLALVPLSLSGLRAEIMRVAAGMAPRVAMVDGLTRVRATLTGKPELRAHAELFGEALALGLSGVASVPTADVAPVAAVARLQARMMAIRLDGRLLVTFSPDRDCAIAEDPAASAPVLTLEACGTDQRTLASFTIILPPARV